MNQILLTNDEGGASSSEMKPVIRFFCVVCIVFATILIFCGAFALYNSLGKAKDYLNPTLVTEKEGSHLNIKINGEIDNKKVAIGKFVYSWNDGGETTLDCSGRSKVNLQIEMPQGNNKLHAYVIDVEGNKTKYEDIEVSFTEEEDTIKPTIALDSVERKLQIKATDNKELAYISYQWEGGEEIKFEAEGNDKSVIIQTIDVEKGRKKITIKAVDKSGNERTLSQTIVGSDGPKIKVSLSSGNFVVKVTDEYGITKIEYTHNEEPHTVEDLPEGTKEYEFKVPLKDGANYLKINAFENGIMTEYKCKKTK